MPQTPTTEAHLPLDDVDAVAIEAVFARLAAVDVDGLTPAACEQWLTDALRVSGWLTVTRLQVEQAQWELTLAGWHTPEPEPTDESDPAGDPASDAGALPAPDDSDGSQRSSAAAGPEPSSGAGAPGRTSRQREARDRKIKQAIALLASFGKRLERGELTEDHVLAVGTIRNREAARAQEAVLLTAALDRTAEEFATWLCAWDAMIDLDRHGNLTARQKAARKLQLFSGSHEFRGVLAPADFDAFKRTLVDIDAELERRRDRSVRLSWDQRMADAFVEMIHRARGGSSEASLRAAVVVLIDLDDLLAGTGHGTTADGSIVESVRSAAWRPPSTSSRSCWAPTASLWTWAAPSATPTTRNGSPSSRETAAASSATRRSPRWMRTTTRTGAKAAAATCAPCACAARAVTAASTRRRSPSPSPAAASTPPAPTAHRSPPTTAPPADHQQKQRLRRARTVRP